MKKPYKPNCDGHPHWLKPPKDGVMECRLCGYLAFTSDLVRRLKETDEMVRIPYPPEKELTR